MASGAAHALGLLAVPTAAVAVAALARRWGIAAPLALVVAGLVGSELPGVPQFGLDPEFVLYVFLPPLLFAAAWQSSYFNLRENLKPIALLSIGLVLFTTLVVGYTATWLVPGLPLSAGFVLGAIVAPPDAVAAVSIARRLGLPRRMVTILVGESLFNDATALTVFSVAIAATVGQGVSALGGVGRFCYAAIGGAAIGLVLGPVLHWLRGRLDDDPITEVTTTLLAPFAAYLIAELVHASGVMAVVVAGLYLGHRFTERPGQARLLGYSFWRVVVFLLESVVFLLIGLQLPAVLKGLRGYSWLELTGYAAAVFAATVVARFAWLFLISYPFLPKTSTWRTRTVVSWAGMRGVVSLAAAFAIPLTVLKGAPFPGRDLLLFLTFTTVLATLLVQGLTFPALIHRLGIGSERERQSDMVAEAAARHEAAGAAMGRLQELAPEEESEEIVQKLLGMAEHRQIKAWERLGGGTGMGGSEVPSATYRRLRLEMIQAERATVVRLRDERRIDDEVLSRALHDLDLEETMLSADPYAD